MNISADMLKWTALQNPLNLLVLENSRIGSVLRDTLLKDVVSSKEMAWIEVYKRMRPGDPPTLVADASLATFPANTSPRFAVNASISFASLKQLVTQVSWVKLDQEKP